MPVYRHEAHVLHADRIARGYCDHCNSCGNAASGSEQIQSKGNQCILYFQSETGASGFLHPMPVTRMIFSRLHTINLPMQNSRLSIPFIMPVTPTSNEEEFPSKFSIVRVTVPGVSVWLPTERIIMSSRRKAEKLSTEATL